VRLAEFVERALSPERPLRVVRVKNGGAFLVSQLRAAHPGPILVVSPSSRSTATFAADLQAFSPGATNGLDGRDGAATRSPPHDIRIFPRYDTPPFDRFSPHPEIEARRMSLLYALLAAEETTPLTVLAPWKALVRRVPPRAELRSRVTHLERGLPMDRDALLGMLVSAGYQRTALVEERGEVASRGSILDLFPPQLSRPVRLEFDFDEIGSLREFDPETQRSDRELDTLIAIPPRAYRLPHDLEGLLQRVRQLGRERQLPESNIYELTESLGRRHLRPGIENLEALLHDHMETVFDYLPASTLVVVDDPETARERGARHTDAIFAAHALATHQDRLVCDPVELYTTDDSAWDAINARHPVLLDSLGVLDPSSDEERIDLEFGDHRELRREVQQRLGSGRALAPLAERLRQWMALERRVRITCPSLSSVERLVEILSDYDADLKLGRSQTGEAPQGWPPWPERGAIDLAIAPLASGFELPSEDLVVLTEQDVFGARLQRRAVRATRRGQAVERLAQIQLGDTLVHAEHGIGQYGGLVQLLVGGIQQELLLLLYHAGDKLYIPVSRLGQIQRYSGADGTTSKLDRLGGQTWTRTKARVKRAVRDMAEELLAVVAAREVLKGHAYSGRDPDYDEFEAGFAYEDTPDQRRATEDVLADLQKERPMDRLVCGDVGFGKTEIACRAAYLVTAAGRQVALLVPTTVLCQQHVETLKQRFANTAVSIASLSRLSTPKEIRQVRESLASGSIDIVVGTHRLLSKDIQLRSLGMLIVDEEHRFGVAHKERLKQLRKLVDVLTLSATPIPRTLQLAFSGMRDLSLITTPPPDRTAVRTEVCRPSEEIIRDAVYRELRRGGQVFFVHNRVETIREFGAYLQRVLPDVKIAIAHGQMSARKLEEVMLAFMRRECDLLVCTAIIESGLDIPNANTILIDRADHFGLAQLYQLRGRVGRSDRRAYAYLFLPATGQLSNDARQRLEAIQDLSDLGAGFRLASEDLEIRGAGNLLGAEQSGNVAAVGYDLYMEMLEEAVQKLRGEGPKEGVEPEIRLPLAALLPDSYVADPNQRLVLYKQLSSARNDAELLAIRDDVLDRFGPIPTEGLNLIDVIRLKIRCAEAGIEAVEVAGDELVLKVSDAARIDPGVLAGLLQQPDSQLRVTPEHRIYLKLRRSEDALAESFGLLALLAPDAADASQPSSGEPSTEIAS
jgi:transcription-repair coupling factor (superfamily II helicase)